jgi:hypothetical protein
LSQDIFRQREIVKGRATAQGRQLWGRITLAHRDEQAEKLAVAASRLELEEELRSYGRAELEQVRAIRSESISLWTFAVAFLCAIATAKC